jgi:hypothetical protein
MKRLAVISTLVLFAALVLPGSAFAAEGAEGRIIIGDNFTLESGEILDGDLLVIGGNVTLEEDSLVEGDVFVVGGNVRVHGVVDGDLGVVGGQVTLEDESVIQGDVGAIGGHVDRREGAEVEGDYFPSSGFQAPFDFAFPTRIWTFPPQVFTPLSGFGVRVPGLFRVGTKLFNSLLMAALAVLAVVFWPEPARRVAKAAVDQPLPAGGLGLLSLIFVPILLLLLLITIILSPLSLVGIVVLVAAWAFGVISIGLEVGHRLANALNWDLEPPVEAGLGTLLLSLVVAGIGMVTCIGWIPRLLLASLALGAVMLTRFGSRVYMPAAGGVVPVDLEGQIEEGGETE